MNRNGLPTSLRLNVARVWIIITTIAGLLVLGPSRTTQADADTPPLSPPQGTVVLSIQGNVQIASPPDTAPQHSERKVDFDMAMLMALPVTRIETTTPWTKGLTHFEGVAIKDLLRAVAATGEISEFTALNDYTVRIPLNDFSQFGAIIAYKVNGKMMGVRDKGPLWVIYPLDAHTQLQNAQYRDRMIWQLRSITVK